MQHQHQAELDGDGTAKILNGFGQLGRRLHHHIVPYAAVPEGKKPWNHRNQQQNRRNGIHVVRSSDQQGHGQRSGSEKNARQVPGSGWIMEVNGSNSLKNCPMQQAGTDTQQ